MALVTPWRAPEWVLRLPAAICPACRDSAGERCWRTYQSNADAPRQPPGLKQFRCSKWTPAPEDFDSAVA